jgi:hypothetical protein
VGIDLSVVPARLGIWFFTCSSDNRNTRSTCPTSVFTGIGQMLMSRPELLFLIVTFTKPVKLSPLYVYSFWEKKWFPCNNLSCWFFWFLNTMILGTN